MIIFIDNSAKLHDISGLGAKVSVIAFNQKMKLNPTANMSIKHQTVISFTTK